MAFTPYTPSMQGSGSVNPSGFQAFNPSQAPQASAAAQVQTTPGTMVDGHFVPGQNQPTGIAALGANLKALPGQFVDALSTLGNKITGGGANTVGEGLGTAAANVGLLSQGKNPNIPVDVPKMAGGVLASGAAIASAGLPVEATAPSVLGRIGQSALGYGSLGALGAAGSTLANTNDGTRGLATSLDVAKNAAIGGATGAIAGGVGQGISEGVNAVKAASRAQPTLNDTISVISPKATPVAGSQDISLGKGKPATLFRKATIDQSETPYIQKAAQDVYGLVSSKNSMIENVNNVHDAIQNISKDTVKPFLSENPVPFNFEDLQNSLSQVKPSSSLKSDSTAFSTYNRVKDEVQQTIYDFLKQNPERGNSTDMNNLWDARKVVDQKIAQELGDSTFGSPQYTGVKAAARDMRNAVNDFIVNSITHPGQMEQVNAMNDFLQTARSRGMDIPNEKEAMVALARQFGLSDTNAIKAAVFKDSLSRMSGMYDAISNMAPKAYSELGKTGVNLLMSKHPVIKKLIGAGLTGVGLGAGFKGIEAL